MKQHQEILIIIPARGGSKGIPRKNLRVLNGKPLIYYTVSCALHSGFKPDVYVSSEDEEILTLAKKFGAGIHKRPKTLSDDKTTLDPVIVNAFGEISKLNNKKYDLIISIQPTSPLLRTKSLDAAIEQMLAENAPDTLLSATNDTHLTWKYENGKYLPNFTARVNRQDLVPVYRETGGFVICTEKQLSTGSRIGKNVGLFLLNGPEKIDIDSLEDWNLCQYYLKTKTVLFVVSGYSEIGLGHVYNTLSLADELTNHQVIFLADNRSGLAYDRIQVSNYRIYIQKHKNILDDIREINPDVVINDMLDTSESYMNALKKSKYCVINFEDLGAGTKYADLVINAMYPEKDKPDHHYYGHRYFFLRNEFLYTTPKTNLNDQVKNVLITYGGVDPNNYTYKTLKAIYPYCIENDIAIHVAAGMGYAMYDSLQEFRKIVIHKNSNILSELVSQSDIVFTSAGRTTFEVASVGIPTIVLCQNERETTHFFATSKYGFINLGLGYQLDGSFILQQFTELCNNADLRKHLNEILIRNDIRNGKKRIIKLIDGIIDQFFDI